MTRYVSYPRTPHLPWSPGLQGDDRRVETLEGLRGEEIVVTEKLDGENTTMYRDHVHARSIDSRHHPSRNWVMRLHAHVAHQIPNGWRLCGENVYATHSIHYETLATYFYLFSVWTDEDVCLGWDETREWAALLDLALVPTLYRGPYDEERLRALYEPVTERGDPMEGYVVRVARAFPRSDFERRVAKYVRAGHVQTDEHWMHQPVEPNELAEDATGLP